MFERLKKLMGEEQAPPTPPAAISAEERIKALEAENEALRAEADKIDELLAARFQADIVAGGSAEPPIIQNEFITEEEFDKIVAERVRPAVRDYFVQRGDISPVQQ